MLPFLKNSNPPTLPLGFVLDVDKPPRAQSLNRLLSRCSEDTYPPNLLKLALEKSAFNMSIWQVKDSNLVGFVRATSDRGLNANLWNLVAEPGDNQQDLLKVLVYNALKVLRRDMPGCSVSVSAKPYLIKPLKSQGFLLDPGGIRAMGFKL